MIQLTSNETEKVKPLYILTWNATMPTAESHHQKGEKLYSTWDNAEGNLVDDTLVHGPDFKLSDSDYMTVGLKLNKYNNERSLIVLFKLMKETAVRVKCRYTITSKGKVLWSNEQTGQLKAESVDEWMFFGEKVKIPDDLPKNILVTVEVYEWEVFDWEPKENESNSSDESSNDESITDYE